MTHPSLPDTAVPVRRVVFALDEHSSAVELVDDGDTLDSLVVPLGVVDVAQRYFRTDPPTPLAMEQAIEEVEEAVMQYRTLVPEGAAIHWASPLAQRVLALASGHMQDTAALASVEQVEALFNRLVYRIHGRPAVQDSVPTDALFVATVLMLREFLHHTLARSVQLA